MTCFWNGIISSLYEDDFIPYNSKKIHNPLEFVIWLKSKNIKTLCVFWNDLHLSEMHIEENYKAVQDLDHNSINNGYDCSTFDPFLFLIAELFSLKIEHNFNGIIIVYSHINPKKTVRYRSDTGHFSHIL